MLNCWLVALWMWLGARCKSYIWTRRSKHFRGLITHAGTAQPGGFRSLFVTEYVPPKADIWTRRNFVLLFDGRYRVWEFRAVKCWTFDSMQAVREHINGVKSNG